MEFLGSILEKKILFSGNRWSDVFPNENWAIIIIADEKETELFIEIINRAIDRNVGYIVSVGKQFDFINDIADEEITSRKIGLKNHYLPLHSIITVGEEDIENGLWFGIYCSLNEETPIGKILVLDVEKKHFEKVTRLIDKFQKGYIPREN